MRLEVARKAEDDFFASDVTYASYRDQLGTGNLAKRINRVLHTHIAKVLPTIRSSIVEMRG